MIRPSTRRCSPFLLILLFPALAETQPDPASIAAECLNELDIAQTAASEDDSGRALVHLDLAGESCQNARSELVRVIGDEPDANPVALSTLWQMELRRIGLLTTLEQCDDARDALQHVSAQAPLPASIELEYARSAHATMACGPRPGQPTHGTISVSPGMVDIVQTGVTLGERDLSGLTDCWGYVPNAPSLLMEVTTDMQLSLMAYSEGDLVLYVTGPSGPFCNDDWDGLNPGVSEYLVAGTYEVYVGEYSPSGYAQNFSLTASTNPLWSSTPTYPTYGEVYVGPGYGRTTMSGEVWGIHDAATRYDPTCSGFVAESPDFRMYVDVTAESWVTVTGSTGADLTLVVDGPSGRFCLDDVSGTNPVLHETLSAGSYDIFVGDKAGPSTGASYGIQFSSYDPMLVLSTEATHGTASLGLGDPPATLSGSVSGAIPASDFFGSTCYGSIGTGPSHTLTLRDDAQVEVVARSSAYGDLVIALTGPSGTFCNDDYDGLNPGVSRFLTAGDYRVYVGELSATPGGTPFSTTFTVSPGTPPPDLSAITTGTFGHATLGYGSSATTLSGTSGGPNRADTLDPSCHGYLSEAPSFVVELSDYVYTTIRVMSEGDTTLVLMGPDGIVCNDDYAGFDPGVEQYLSPGRYGVWVGSYAAGTSHNFMISFSSEGAY